MNTLAIQGLTGREYIPTRDILYLQADINYTTIHTLNEAKHVTSFTLKNVENRISDASFLRINRGITINSNYLQHISHLKKEAFVMLSNGLVLPVSRRRYNEIQEKLKFLN